MRNSISFIAAACVLSWGAAHAEEKKEELPEKAVEQLEEQPEEAVLPGIVITGEKVVRDYKDTYSSVGVVTGEEVETYKIDDLRDAFNNMANVRWFDGNFGNNGFVIRGVNSEGVVASGNIAPVASVVIDGAIQSVESTRRGARGMWDIKQVEVLRGPQSTLQGRSALAGTVLIETNDPSFEPSIGLQGIVAQDERTDGAFYATGPLLKDEVAFRVSSEVRKQTKDIEFANAANNTFAEDEYRNLRGKLLITPSAIPELSILLTASTTFDKPGVAVADGNNLFDRRFVGAASNVEFREGDNNNYVADVEYELNDYLTLQSITSRVAATTRISTPVGAALQRVESREGDDVTQDLRLLIGEEGDKLSGVVGLFYGDVTHDVDSLITFAGLPFPVQDVDILFRTRERSGYFDLRYRFDGGFGLHGGLRYTSERIENEISGTGINAVFAPVAINLDEARTENVLLPKVGLTYDLTDSQTIGISVKKAYRSGFAQVANGIVNQVEPETLWAYELAYRFQAPDNSLTFGATAFYYDYRDQQFSTGLVQQQTINIPKSKSYGLELEGRYNHGNGLSTFGALGLMKSEFDDANTPVGNFNGNEFPQAPKMTATVGVAYEHDSGFHVSADANYTAEHFGAVNNNNATQVDSYVVANLRTGYQRGDLKFTAFVDNLFDQEYVTSLVSANEGFVGDRRKFGVSLSAKF